MEDRIWHKHYDAGIPTSLDYADVPLAGVLEGTAKRFPDATALIFMNTRMTYAELWDHVRRMATAMSKLGVRSIDQYNTRVQKELEAGNTTFRLLPRPNSNRDARAGSGTH